MLLEGRTAVVYGGGGAMGGAVARAFARAGATVQVTGRTQGKLEKVAEDIKAGGGRAMTAVVDAYDVDQVEGHLAGLEQVDISFNAVGLTVVQNKPLVELTVDEFVTPVAEAARTQFVTATAVARRMMKQGHGVIILLSSSASRESGYEMGGFSVACAATECFNRALAGEVGPHGVRVVTIRPNFTPETSPEPVDLTSPDLAPMIQATALRRLPRLAEVAETAVFLASEHAGAMTGAIVNLSCGAIVD
jgi:3-oxoacyl-[acyl-carrier protein] reductase